MSAEKIKTILLVEDEVISAMAGKIALENHGNKVMTAYSGEEAVAAVEKTPAIDLVLMDINLGAGIDGTEAAEIILKNHDLPVVFLSSHTEAEVVGRTEKITSYGYIVKSSSSTVLDASIKMAFKLFEAKTREKEKESQREAALAALRESEEKYRTLVEKGNEAISIAQDGVLVFVNHRMSEFLGVPDGTLEGKPFIDFVWPEDRELVRANYWKRIAGEPVRDAYDFRIIGAGGVLNWIFLSSAVIQWNGKPATLNLLTDITERKRAEEALRDGEEMFREMAEQLEDVLFKTDERGTITYISPSASRVFGWLPGEMTGRSFTEFLQESDIPKAMQAFQATISSGRPNRNLILLMKRRDDSVFIGELKGSPLAKKRSSKGTLGLIRDISERKRAEAALGESEVRFRELFTRMSSGVAVYEAVDDGEDFIIRDFNPAAEKIEKVSRQDILGKRVSAAFPGVKAFGVFQVFQRVWRTGEAEYFPENLYKPEGVARSWRESWRESWVFKLPAGEIVAIYNDISERKQAAEEIQRQLTEKEILLREVHHRIKNNIASIGGLLTLQAQAVTNPEAIAVLQDAIGRVTSMQILYDKMLLSEGYKDISVKNYVESLVASVVALFPENAKVTLDQRIDDFKLDAKQLSPLGIIINELITNIMKYAFRDLGSGLIRITLVNSGRHVTLAIQDDGIGLPEGFDIDHSTGFGLMLVKMLSQQLGGSFSIKMHEGTLCRVEFDI